MSSLSTTDVIKIQLQQLVTGHQYKVTFQLHNPSTLEASLDRNEINFTASGSKQNIFVLVKKSSLLPIVSLEVVTQDLTDDTTSISTMFVRCGDYTGCETDNSDYFVGLSLDMIP